MPNVLVLSGPALPLLKMAEEMKPEGYELNVCTSETEVGRGGTAIERGRFCAGVRAWCLGGDSARGQET